MTFWSLPGATLEGPPLPISVWQCCPVDSAAFWFVLFVLTRIPERSYNRSPRGPKSPQNGLRRPLGRLLVRPGAPTRVTLNRPVASCLLASMGVLGCLWGGFGGDRAGTLINRRFGVLCLAFFDPFGGVFLMFFRCLLGASPALFVVLVSSGLLCRLSSRRCSYFARGENGRYRKNQ